MIGNIIVAAIVLIILGLAAWKVIKDRNKGGSCGCGCDHCAANESCHKETNGDDGAPPRTPQGG